jgi:hypothetical protein
MPVQQLFLPCSTRNAGEQRLALAGGHQAIRSDDSRLAGRRNLRVGDTLVDIRHGGACGGG